MAKKPGLILGLKDAVTTNKEETTATTEIPVPAVPKATLVAASSEQTPDTAKAPEAHWMADISAVIARLERMEAENKRLRENQERLEANSPEAIIKARKERYNWPRKYSFKTFEGKIVCDLKTVKNNVLRNYKKWGYDVEQVVKLTFADGSTKEVDYDEFSQTYQRSEKMFIDSEIKKDGKTFYVFLINGEQVAVSESVIN